MVHFILRVALAAPAFAIVFATPSKLNARQLSPLPEPGKPKLMMANNAVNWLANVTIGDQVRPQDYKKLLKTHVRGSDVPNARGHGFSLHLDRCE